MLSFGVMSRSFLPRVLGLIPPSVRRTVIGRSDRPSKIATILHNLFNRAPQDGSEMYPCHGTLQGFKMSTDWKRYRGYVYGNWEPVATEAIKSSVTLGMCAFDIGAHLGYYSLLLAKCVGPIGHVVSFEAAPNNFLTLQRNVSVNDLKNVQLINQAVYSQITTISMSVSTADTASGDWSIIREPNGASIQVQTIVLDRFCEEHQIFPDFLKIDVEGAEYDVLLGGREVIARRWPTMLIELHHFDGNLEANLVPDLLRKWNYEIRWLERWSQTSQILAQPISTKPVEEPQFK
jgi:FkbM family methyltransferase